MLTSELDFVQNKSEIHCSQDGEKNQHEYRIEEHILDLKRLGKTTRQISRTLSKSGAIWDMLFRIHEVFEAVYTAGLSLKKILFWSKAKSVIFV